MESKILDMYFKEKMKQIDIATKLGVSKYKVSRVIAKDPRSKEEKENIQCPPTTVNNRKKIPQKGKQMREGEISISLGYAK